MDGRTSQYHSGPVTCRKEPELEALGNSLILDLGSVADTAEVWCNGKRVGIRWARPLVFDLTDAARAGASQLQIRVTNTWRNQLIHDLGRPTRRRRGPPIHTHAPMSRRCLTACRGPCGCSTAGQRRPRTNAPQLCDDGLFGFRDCREYGTSICRSTKESERVRTTVALVLVGTAAASLADDLNSVSFGPPPDHAPVALAREGQPRSVVVVPESSSRIVREAVRDLIHYVERTTGAGLASATTPPDTGSALVVTWETEESQDAPGMFTIRTSPERVMIEGEDAQGAAWGIYEFLERFVGVRWYWPEYKDEAIGDCGTSIIPSPDLVVPPVCLGDAPTFRKRVRWPSGGRGIGTAKMRDHDRRHRCADTWPVQLIVHAPHGWESIYRESRPEIFQLRRDGQRDFSMLCYGHPRTLETYLEETELQRDGEFERDRKRSILRGNAITVSPADMSVACRCQRCRALWQEDAGNYGSASAVLGTFVANLGREVAQRWPEMTVVFLPYKNYTYAPEGIEFPGNVEVQICGMPGMAMYKEPSVNASEQANIDAWAKLTGRRIQNWHYSCWPAHRTKAAYLFPHVVQKHYQANRSKTVGSFINGTGDHWPRQHLSMYVWLKALWNPDIDVDAVIEEHCQRMYGPASATMRKLIGMQIDRWENVDWEGAPLSPKTVYEKSFPRETVLEMESLLGQAVSEAKNDELASRRIAYLTPAFADFIAESALLAGGGGIKPLRIYQVAEDPVIDGKLTDDEWQGVEPVPFVKVAKDGSKAEFPTELRAVWTRRGVTFGFRMVEPDVADLKRDILKESRDASLIWWNDNVEVFLDPTGKREGYIQFIVNPNGAIWDSVGREDSSWDPPGVRAAGHVGDGFWSAELFLPYGDLTDPLPPGTGTTWYGNFTRHRVTDRKHREYQGYNVIDGAAPSHNQNAFGPLEFIER